jgi:uncharacterized protein (DUF305 family)
VSRWAAVALMALLVLPALGTGQVRPVVDNGDEAAVGFARDMAVHHQQAVEMSLIVWDRGTDEDVRRFAYEIANTQATQRGMLLGRLAEWGRSPTSSRPPMAWMGMPATGPEQRATGVLMPGMAPRAAVDALASAPPEEAEQSFLRLMIAHHLGGVHMALGVLERTGDPLIRRLASGMETGQRAEIALARTLLEESF